MSRALFFTLGLFSLLCLIPSSKIYGKDGKVKYGTTFYRGEVENKIPKGQGALFVKEDEEVIMTGLFDNQHVSNAKLKCVDFEFTGELIFEPGLDKHGEIGRFQLLQGEIRFNSHSQQYELLKPISFVWGKRNRCTYSDIDWILKSSLGSEKYYLHYREYNIPNYAKYDERNIDSIYYANGEKAIRINYSDYKFVDIEGNFVICKGLDRNKRNIIKLHKFDKSAQCTIDAKKIEPIFLNGSTYDDSYSGEIKYNSGNCYNGEFVINEDGTIRLINGNMIVNGLTDAWLNGVNISQTRRDAIKKAVALLKNKLETSGTVVYIFKGTGSRNDKTPHLSNYGLEPNDLFYDCKLVLKNDGSGSFESFFSPSDEVAGKQLIHYKRNGGAVRHPEYVKEFCQSAIGVKTTGTWKIDGDKLILGESEFSFVDDKLIWHSIEDCSLKMNE